MLGVTDHVASRAAMASVAAASVLLVLKSYAAWATGSVAMLGSLADSGLDLLASAVALYSVRLAAQPADADHRFGHGKAEALAALFQIALITLSAGAICVHAVNRLDDAAAPMNIEYGVGVSAIAIAVTLALVSYQRRALRKSRSLAVRTDNLHYESDLYLNLSVIAALVLEQVGGLRGADALFGLGIALWLAWNAWRAANHAIDELMDREWPDEKRQRFLAVASQHPELKGIHDLRTRTSGTHDFVQFHVWVDPAMTVAHAHQVMDEVEEKLAAAFPGTEVLIHPDPEGHRDPPLGRERDWVQT